VSVVTEKKCIARPFLKWAGGKSQLLPEIERRLPEGLKTGEIDTYIEPFVGGGAVFFYIAQRYEEIKKFYLFDINNDLVKCYNAIKNDVESRIDELGELEDEFPNEKKARKEYFYKKRKEFNSDRCTAKLIFLNKTCFNGLYRVNRKDEFNVPSGDYKNPKICDAENLRNVSQILQKVEIICGDFETSDKYINDKTFVYFDPPYRPLSPTASFTSYSKDDFNEAAQIRLAQFCRHIDAKDARFLLSNSDPKNENPNDHFFEDNYPDFKIERVNASRVINCKGSKRGYIKEILVMNY